MILHFLRLSIYTLRSKLLFTSKMAPEESMKPGSADMEKFFSKVAETYEDSIPIMKDVARNVVKRTPPITSDSVILDNACGPGIVTGEIVKQCRPDTTPELFAADYSSAMIEQLRKHDWASKVQSEVMDAQDLKYPDDKFTHSFTNFALMAIPDPLKAAKQIYRTLKPGGTAAITTWKHLGYMVIFHDAQRKVKPDSRFLPGPRSIADEWMGETIFRSTLEAAGFQAKNIEITTETAVMSSDMGGKGLELMKNVLVNDVVQGWTDKEKDEYSVALKEQFEQEYANPRPTEMVAWVAVVRKEPLDGEHI
jgi:ubiquinone/menaquinone biosynthesis C-methylase UbiE